MIAVHDYRLANLELKITELCDRISDLLDKMPEKYQTKEMCSNTLEHCREINNTKLNDIEEEVKELNRMHNRLVWGLACCGGVIAWDLVKYFIINK